MEICQLLADCIMLKQEYRDACWLESTYLAKSVYISIAQTIALDLYRFLGPRANLVIYICGPDTHDFQVDKIQFHPYPPFKAGRERGLDVSNPVRDLTKKSFCSPPSTFISVKEAIKLCKRRV